jgi:hypothetical protein
MRNPDTKEVLFCIPYLLLPPPLKFKPTTGMAGKRKNNKTTSKATNGIESKRSFKRKHRVLEDSDI